MVKSVTPDNPIWEPIQLEEIKVPVSSILLLKTLTSKK